jgi:salicylate hydroxylase
LIAADGANSIVRSHYFPHAQTLDQGFSSIYMLIEAIAGGTASPPHFNELANGTAAFYSWGSYATNIIFPEGKDRLTLALNFDHKTGSRVWRAHDLMPNVPWSAIDPAVKKSIAKTMARDTPAYDFVMEKALDLVVDWNAPTVYSWDMRDSDPLDQPYAPDANIVFLGDSVRAFLPTIGMGASLAIEDAQWLGTQLGNYLKDSNVLAGDDLRNKVFEPYREARSEIWRDLIDRARIGARNFINQHEMKHFEQASMVPTPIGKAIAHSLESTRRTLGV